MRSFVCHTNNTTMDDIKAMVQYTCCQSDGSAPHCWTKVLVCVQLFRLLPGFKYVLDFCEGAAVIIIHQLTPVTGQLAARRYI